MMSKLFVLLLAVSATSVLSFPVGAPETVCNTMFPEHGGVPQTTPAPVRILVSNNRVRPGQTVTFTIESTSGTFRGFMLQTRLEAIAGRPIGTFLPGAGYSIVNCEGPTTTTHVDNSDKTRQTFTWTAPQITGGVRAQ